MRLFLTGTDTEVGKTLISSWLCLHTSYHYFKPIQSGNSEGSDSTTVHQLSNATIYPSTFSYQAPLSPHLSAQLEGKKIDMRQIILPSYSNLIVEGAGGILVPLHKDELIIDLIKYLALPVIIVARAKLGTINHTLLTLESLRTRRIPVLGVIVNGHDYQENAKAIAQYGHIPILASFPSLSAVTFEALQHIPLTLPLQQLMKGF